MSRKAPRKPYHYNKKSSSRTKPQSDVSLKFALNELLASGYTVVTTEDTSKHRKASILALAWFQKDFPDAKFSKSGRTIQMDDKFGTGSISVPVSDGQLSRDALKDLRKRTGLALDPQTEDTPDVPHVSANDNSVSAAFDDVAEDVGDFKYIEKEDSLRPASDQTTEEDDDDDFDWEDDDVYVVVEKAVAPVPEVEKSRTVTRTRRPRESDPRP